MAIQVAAPHQQNDGQIWWYLLFSAFASTLGCTVILADVIWNKLFPKRQFSILEGHGFLSRALCLSGGTLLTAALYELLPQAMGYIAKIVSDSQCQNFYLFGAFALGLSLCWLLNAVIHLCTAQSVVHCAHDVEQDVGNDHSHSHNEQLREDNSHTHYHSHTVGMTGEDGPPSRMSRRSLANLMGCDENSGLLDENSLLLHHQHTVHQHYTLPENTEFSPAPPPMLLAATTRVLRCHGKPGTCRGFMSIKRCSKDVHDTHCTCGDQSLTSMGSDEFRGGAYYDPRDTECPEDQADPQLHHHHVATQSGQLYSIGIQTAAAITMHKLPEGFMMYATNRADKNLGFQVFVALALHNFTEGFSVASPLYVALRSRFWALLVSIVLCGGSQPLGALLAKIILKDRVLDDDSSLELGLIVASVAGFMTTIGIQMVAMPAFFGGSQRVVVSWTTLGMLFVLLVNCI